MDVIIEIFIIQIFRDGASRYWGSNTESFKNTLTTRKKWREAMREPSIKSARGMARHWIDGRQLYSVVLEGISGCFLLLSQPWASEQLLRQRDGDDEPCLQRALSQGRFLWQHHLVNQKKILWFSTQTTEDFGSRFSSKTMDYLLNTSDPNTIALNQEKISQTLKLPGFSINLWENLSHALFALITVSWGFSKKKCPNGIGMNLVLYSHLATIFKANTRPNAKFCV